MKSLGKVRGIVPDNRSKTKTAAWAGFDLSTTGLGLGVRSRGGDEAYVHVEVCGATTWHGQPAFALDPVPDMISDLLDQLDRDGWEFRDTSFSFAVRQHDMVLLGEDGQPLIPALSWQCDAASAEVQKLRRQAAEEVVGRIEERFILPKLMWALGQDSNLKRAISQVMTTGDWIATLLTGTARLSTSDALSNGLLEQKTKKLAEGVMRKAGLNPGWFPQVLQSGRPVGKISSREPFEGGGESWMALKNRLAGSSLVSGLGDNHATGVGCGLEESDFDSIVVSAGTSGTVNRVCRANVSLAGNAACFEYYKNRLLLMMLADCCVWYDRFVKRQAADYVNRLDALNGEAERADLGGVRRVMHVGGKEIYSPDWENLTLGQKVASTQLSIMLELLLLVRGMLAEVSDAKTPVSKFVLTGGLSQSSFFQKVFQVGVQLLNPQAKVLISARQGPLRYQTAAYGALLNAMRPRDLDVAGKLCPTRPVARTDAKTKKALGYLLRAFGL